MAARGGGVRRKAPGEAQRNLKSWDVKLSWGQLSKEFKELVSKTKLVNSFQRNLMIWGVKLNDGSFTVPWNLCK